MKTSEHSLRQRPGTGVLARYGNLVLLCEAAPGHDDQIRDLLDAMASAAGTENGGRQLGRRVAGALATTGPDGGFPALCAFGPVGGGIAVLVHGRAELTVAAAERELQLDGRDAVTFINHVVREPVTSIRAALGACDDPSPIDQWSELESGVVRADALVYGPRDTSPTRSQAPAELTDNQSGTTRVRGVSCRNAHFNDPMVAYCAVCGLGMTQAGRMPVFGDRPQLGVLVLDNGSTIPLARDLVLGRMPEVDDSVATGRAVAVQLNHPTVSRRHAQVWLDGWEVRVTDAGSANGTFLREPGRNGWIPIPSGPGALLRPGAVLALGHRQLRYDSYRPSGGLTSTATRATIGHW